MILIQPRSKVKVNVGKLAIARAADTSQTGAQQRVTIAKWQLIDMS